MTTLFISDLHLCASRPKTSTLFLKFLSEATDAQALYILGDFFEAWIGADLIDQHDAQILAALFDFSKKTPVYFMPGNRDFLINKEFAKQNGFTLLSDPTVITLYGQQLLLMHGDALCTLDKSYQYYRCFVRHPIIQKTFLNLPKILRQKIANRLRQKASRTHSNHTNEAAHTTPTVKTAVSPPITRQNKYKDPKYWDVVEESVHKALNRHHAQVLIHGHTHKAGIHHFQLNDQPAKRLVLGDWGDVGSVLVCTPKEMTLQTIC